MKKQLVILITSSLLLISPLSARAFVLEGIAFELLKVLSGHLFKNYLEDMDDVRLQGAPDWYYKKTDTNMICVFSTAKGDFDSVEVVRNKAKNKMQQRLSELVEQTAKTQSESINLKQNEIRMIELFKEDQQLPKFISQGISIDKLEYKEKISRAFARGCIEKQIFFDYQKKRLFKLHKQVMKSRSKSAFDEMEMESFDME